MSPLLVSLVALLVVLGLWGLAVTRRKKASGDEEVLLDIAAPQSTDWVVLFVTVVAAIFLLMLLGPTVPAILFALSLLLCGALMFVDNLPAAITARGFRRGLSITPWSEFAGWHWDADAPRVLVLDGSAGTEDQGLVAVPVTDPRSSEEAPSTPTLPSPDDYLNWESFRDVIEAALQSHLPASPPSTPPAADVAASESATSS